MAEDYSGKKLKGQSFKGRMLAGANFRDADLRGADFSGARFGRGGWRAWIALVGGFVAGGVSRLLVFIAITMGVVAIQEIGGEIPRTTAWIAVAGGYLGLVVVIAVATRLGRLGGALYGLGFQAYHAPVTRDHAQRRRFDAVVPYSESSGVLAPGLRPGAHVLEALLRGCLSSDDLSRVLTRSLGKQSFLDLCSRAEPGSERNAYRGDVGMNFVFLFSLPGSARERTPSKLCFAGAYRAMTPTGCSPGASGSRASPTCGPGQSPGPSGILA